MADDARPVAPRLFLVDGYALIYRAFFALMQRPLQTSRGENTSIAWGIANFLRRLLNTHKPELLGWVHDSGATFRDELYPDYKATREKLTEDLQADFDQGLKRVLQLLEAYDIPVLTAQGYEADDVIGTMAKRGAEAGYNVVIISGDKDFQQLVQPKVWLLNPGRGGPASVEESWVGVSNASDRLGVPPERVVDYLAIVGDSSDNVPGVKGIGDKGARELIAQYGPLENILEHAAEISRKRQREALIEYADSARLSKQLVTIHCDVPVEFEPEKLKVSAPNAQALRSLYVELEFSSLLKDVRDIGASNATGSVSSANSSGNSTNELAGQAAQQNNSVAAANASAITTQNSSSGIAIPADSTYKIVSTIAELDALLLRVSEVPFIAIDTETVIDQDSPFAVDPLRSTLVGISIAVALGEAYYLPFAHRTTSGSGNLALLSGDAGLAGSQINAGTTEPVNLPPLGSQQCEKLRSMLENKNVRKIAQNAKYDLLVLRSSGVNLEGLEFDTMLASYVLDPGRRSHGLDLLAFEMLGYQMTAYETVVGKGRNQLSFDVVPVELARDYSCEDVDITMRLRAVLEPMLEAHAQMALLRDIEVPLVPVLADMEWDGIAIDTDWFAALKTRFAKERERVEQLIYSEAGRTFNINSNPQLRTILFDELGLPVKKKTATGPSTDASVLQELADEGHVLPSLLMEYREIFKLEGTYIDALPKLVHPRDNRLHTSYSQTVASTGRLSSHDPNLQNIPVRRELGKDIRRGFVPRKNWKLLSADYSQVELRILAHLSEDSAFVTAFNAGGDIHRQTASIIFGVSIEDVTSEMRDQAKTINFATIYGQGAHSLSRQLRISNAQARLFIDTYFERFAGIRAFLNSCVSEAKAKGYAETLFKRRRYIPELKDRNFNIRAFGERVAQNAPIQGSAADLIKIAMIHIHDRLRRERYASRMLLQVHDELVFELPPEEEASLVGLVKEEMEGAVSLHVPIVVQVGVGANWVAAKS